MEQIKGHPQLWNLFERHHNFRMSNSPEYATFEGDQRFNDQASDFADATEQLRHQALKGFLAEAESLKNESLSAEDQLNHELFCRMLQEQIDEFAFQEHLMPLNQMTGFHLFLPHLVELQPLDKPDKFAAYFKRLRAFGTQVDQIIDNLKLGMERGYVSPNFVIEQTLPQMQKLAADPEQNVFALPLAKLGDHPEKASLTAELHQIIRDVLNPAYEKLHDFTRDIYLPRCRESAGVWDLPNGEAYYQHLIAKYTEPGLSADEIHQIGLNEVTRIRAEQEKIKDALGFQGSLEEFNHHLRTDPQYAFATREGMLEAFETTMATAYDKLPQLFHHLPQATCRLKEVEAYKAESAPQAYYMPAPQDNSRPGYFYINTYDLPSRPIYALTALTLHEAVPGHHLQLALAQELAHLPYFRRRLIVTAYVEGWGLYSEFLGYETDMLQDPIQHYGALTFEIWRACRLVVDTGLHHKRWTRQQAIDFMKAHSANTELDIRNEVDRYLVLPGQALAYKIGELKFKQLRRKAEKHLGERFDIRDFHNVALRDGSLPLATLELQVEQWLKAS